MACMGSIEPFIDPFGIGGKFIGKPGGGCIGNPGGGPMPPIPGGGMPKGGAPEAPGKGGIPGGPEKGGIPIGGPRIGIGPPIGIPGMFVICRTGPSVFSYIFVISSIRF